MSLRLKNLFINFLSNLTIDSGMIGCVNQHNGKIEFV